MIKLFILCALIATVFGSKLARISGGFKAIIEHYPYLVSIRAKEFHICGGSILKPNLIITAASCFTKENITDITIAAGSASLLKPDQVLPVKEFLVHEMFSDSFNRDCNVGLLYLHGNLLFGPTVQPIALQHRQAKPSTAALVSGWGVIVGTGTISHELRAAGVRILSNQECEAAFNGKGFSVIRLLCASVTLNAPQYEDMDVTGPCSGDTGGPLICTDEMALCGITWTWNYACGMQSTQKAVSGYTKINHPDIINWLKRYI